MIDLQALREQLRLLGHDLPDSQIVGILKEMNIDFSDLEGGNAEGKAAAASQRTGSILDSFHGKQQQQSSDPYPRDTSTLGAPPQPLQTFQYGYTGPSAPGYDGGGSGSTIQAETGTRQRQDFHLDAGATYYESDEDDEVEEPGLSCRFCTDGKGSENTSNCKAGGREAVKMSHAWTEAASPAYTHAPSRHGQGPGGLLNDFGRMSLNKNAAGPTNSPCAAYMADRKQGVRVGLAGERMAPRPASAGQKPQRMQASIDQIKASAAYRLQQDDDESDVAVSDPDKSPGPLGAGASRQGLTLMPPHRDWGGHQQTRLSQQQPKLGQKAAAGRDVSLKEGHRDPYGLWFEEAPQHARDVGDPISPQASDRSFVSRASTRTSMGSRGRAKKVDRVQRYQQLQQEWSQNRFLKQANGTARGTSRKPVNFHNHFASLHAAEEAERQRMLRETRARTKKVLAGATEAPTANRRDELRWQTRMRMKEQS